MAIFIRRLEKRIVHCFQVFLFEAGGSNVTSNIDPSGIISNEKTINVSTDRSSCFERNKVAVRLDVLCDSDGGNACPADGVGIYNPGYWGMVGLIDTLLH